MVIDLFGPSTINVEHVQIARTYATLFLALLDELLDQDNIREKT